MYSSFENPTYKDHLSNFLEFFYLILQIFFKNYFKNYFVIFILLMRQLIDSVGISKKSFNLLHRIGLSSQVYYILLVCDLEFITP